MTIGYRSAVSIVEVIFYLPALFIAAYISYRHGFGRNAGWVFLILFSLVRIIGSCCQLELTNKPSKNLFVATAILSSIGLSPLLLTATGLLSRVFDGLHAGNIAARISLRPIQLVTIAGLILCIVGGVNSASSSNISTVSSTTKIGIIMYLAAFAALCVMTLYLGSRTSRIEAGEKRLVLAVAFSLPFLGVRLIYSALASFVHNSHFNIISGSVTILLVMAILEEFVIVITFLATGLSLQVAVKHERLPVVADRTARQDAPSSSGRNARGYYQRGGLIGLLTRTIMGGRRQRQNHDRTETHELSKPYGG